MTMSKLNFTALLAALTLMITAQVFAASNDTMNNTTDHSGHQGHAMKKQDLAKKDGGHGSGMNIHTATHGGYTFDYKLIDMKAKMKNMKNMPEMKDTHHLMVYVKDSHGTAVKKAKVGYFIQEKNSGNVQKKMTMAMSNGFGADVTLEPGKHYTIKTKVMAGEKTLMDEFPYMGGDH